MIRSRRIYGEQDRQRRHYARASSAGSLRQSEGERHATVALGGYEITDFAMCAVASCNRRFSFRLNDAVFEIFVEKNCLIELERNVRFVSQLTLHKAHRQVGQNNEGHGAVQTMKRRHDRYRVLISQRHRSRGLSAFAFRTPVTSIVVEDSFVPKNLFSSQQDKSNATHK